VTAANVKSPKKLIEVALPLDAINVAATREKSIRQGHPSALHLWWARRPLAAARAVIFAQMVNDPGFQEGGGFRYGRNKKEATEERKRLFKIIEELILWENTTNDKVFQRARAEIERSWRDICDLNKDHPNAKELFNPAQLPALHDPFAGGGAIPLEAQRIGLDAYASDLNPVAVLINKAILELPPRFSDRSPVGPIAHRRQTNKGAWTRAAGLAEDVQRYGAWVRAQAEDRIGKLYPPAAVTDALAQGRSDLQGLVGKKLPVIAWLWARTIRSPEPAFSHVHVPLVSSFLLSTKEDKEAYIEPLVDGDEYRLVVRLGHPPQEAGNGTKLARGANFRCILSGAPIEPRYVKAEAKAGRLGVRLLAVVVDGPNGHTFLSPTDDQEGVARSAKPEWRPDLEFAHNSQRLTPLAYGLSNFGSLFTDRQLVALTTYSELITEAITKCEQDARRSGFEGDDRGLDAGGRGAKAYAEAIGVYLALGLSRLADICNALCRWDVSKTQVRNLFGRQVIPMVWDFAENNVFGVAARDYMMSLGNLAKALLALPARGDGHASQQDAQTQTISSGKVVFTDPPYYDNVAYAELSDFFYVWLRKSLRQMLPALFSTNAVPKAEELVADPIRHQGKDNAEAFFLSGMSNAMGNLAEFAHPAFPIAIYYAFNQSETASEGGTSSAGWETFLEAVIGSGLAITGTWPMRTEPSNRMRRAESNALASSLVMVCMRRPKNAPTISRREFMRELNVALPEALDEMTRGSGDERSPVAPADLSQAIIGPGMAVFSKYTAVLEADGKSMRVQTAMQLINRFLVEDDLDHDTQFCLHWFDQRGWSDGPYGVADVLARAKATSVAGLGEAGVLESGAGKVRLLSSTEYPANWDPRSDKRVPIWKALHQMIRALRSDGEAGAAALLAALKPKAEAIQQLAYRLYTMCERAGMEDDARAYNQLASSWGAIEASAGVFLEPSE